MQKDFLDDHLVDFSSMPNLEDEDFDYGKILYPEEEDNTDDGKRYAAFKRQAEKQLNLQQQRELAKERFEAAQAIKLARTRQEKMQIVKDCHESIGSGWWNKKGHLLPLYHSAAIQQLLREDRMVAKELKRSDPYDGIFQEEKRIKINSSSRIFGKIEINRISHQLKLYQEELLRARDTLQREALLDLIESYSTLLQKKKSIVMGGNGRNQLATKFKTARIERDKLGNHLPTRLFIKEKRERMEAAIRKKIVASRTR